MTLEIHNRISNKLNIKFSKSIQNTQKDILYITPDSIDIEISTGALHDLVKVLGELEDGNFLRFSIDKSSYELDLFIDSMSDDDIIIAHNGLKFILNSFTSQILTSIKMDIQSEDADLEIQYSVNPIRGNTCGINGTGCSGTNCC